ncbi:MAG: hypothetical protein GX878_08180 [Firmicutes bacterium]|nr:hypothetical protein [Bacillota bacterium]
MSINWLEVIASIVNFLVLLFLLRHFLYGPIVRIMDEREQKITRRETEAAEKNRQAEEVAADYREKKASLQTKQEELIHEARRAAAAEQSSLTAAARLEVDRKRRQWREALEQEKDSFARELRRQVATQACLVARRCLQDLADARLEEMTWDFFLEKLGAMPAEELSRLKKALLTAGTVTLSSAFAPSDEGLEMLKARLRELTSAEPLFHFRQEGNLLCGLELEAAGHRVAWNMENYLENVEQQILRSLDAADQQKEITAHGS